MANKLYPPYINGTLPAFYISYDSSNTVVKEAVINIPFAKNTAVGETEVKGFVLRLRTASTGSYLFEPIPSASYSLGNEIATFILTADQAKLLNEGQYYKVQIAYVNSENEVGYFSTVGIIKCTSKPKVYINNLSQESANFFTNYYIGTYDQSDCKDQSEKVYSYEFNVYNDDNEIIYTTGERLHQTSYDVDYTYSIDKAMVNDFSATNVTYSIEYKVTTLNGLVLTTPKYKLTNEDLVSPNEEIEILPESNTENGYITIHFKGSLDLNKSWHYILKEEKLESEKIDGEYIKDANNRTAISVVKDALQGQSNKIGFLKKYSFFKIYSSTYGEPGYLYAWANNTPNGKTLYNDKYYDTSALNSILDNIELSEEQKQEQLNNLTYYELISSGRNLVNNLSYKYVKDNYIDITEYPVVDSVPYEAFYYGSYILSRSSDKDNYTTWETIGQFRLDEQAPSQFTVKDMTVEHGRKYVYGLQQTNIWKLVSSRIKSKPYEVSFEDMFLYDGDKLLKIRFNPKVESFKTKLLEQKTDTIGGRFPYITRNGATYYKEFPIGGLIACEMDEDQMFHKRVQGVAHRHSTKVLQDQYDKDGNLIQKGDMPENGMRDWHMFSDENIFLEREFKLAVLDWLNDGKPKLFKSPYEGNYIVRLMNNELKPIEELGRMLHTFTSQAYEIAECNYENLVNYGFINATEPSEFVGLWRTYQLNDPELLNASGDTEITFDAGLETFTVQDLMPGDIIYLEFFDGTVEPIMIGITGSYTYTVGADKPVRKLTISPYSEIEQTSSRNTTGIVNCYYQGVRITAFDAILSQQLRTIPSQQYIGVSPWLERTRRTQWDAQDNYGQNSFDVTKQQYKEFQNYNFRDYLDDIVTKRDNTDIVSYKINENFQKYMYSFDPGELLERISLTLNKGEVYKTQLLKIEQAHFRLREIIPVYIIEKYTITDAADFKYQRKDGPYADEAKTQYSYMVATSPYGYPHRIEELTEYEMIDPFCIYEVFDRGNDKSWIPIDRPDGPYYDPYYRTWAVGYDPTYKINYQWKKIIWAPDENTANLLEQYKQEELYKKNRDKPYDPDYLYDYIIYKELVQDNDDSALQVYKYCYNDNKGNKVLIKDGFDLFQKEGTKYFSYGNTTGIFGNTGIPNELTEEEKKKKAKDFIFFVKEYDSVISLATIKEKHYTNLKDINSIHIGNAVIAELTFQIKIIDYYTEVKDAKVRQAKADYLQAKEFYINLMKNYSLIADADYYRTKYSALKNMYNILIKGNVSMAQLTDQDRRTLFNLLKNSYEVERLNLLKLYKVESINPDLETNIINKLVAYKMDHLEEDRYNIDNIKMLYYLSEGNITFYVLDNNDIKVPSYSLESEEYNYSYFRQLKDNGDIVYYKVDLDKIKQLYFSANGENAFLNINGLTVIYNADGYTKDNINYFIGNTNNLFNNQINSILQLEESTDIPTTQDIQLLNDEQVEELKKQDTFISIEEIPYNEETIEKTFFELETLEDYVDNLTKMEGVEDKAKDLQEEINKFNDQITELTDTINNETETYIQLFNELQNYINEFNDKVYTSWAYQEMINLLAKGEPIDSIRRVFTGQTDEIKVKVDENANKLIRYINSAKNLYYLMLDALPKINRYQQMKNDGVDPTGANDEDLDDYLEKQIMEKRGNLVLYILAMYDAIDKAIDFIKENHDHDYELQYKSQLIEAINYYNELYSLVISSNNILQQEYYDSMEDFIQNKINEFNTLYAIELSLLRESYSYTNPETYATLCNYYDDIKYLQDWRYPQGENVKNSIIFDNNEYKVFKIKLPVGDGEENKFNDNFFTNQLSLAISINPMWKIEFREEQNRFSKYQFSLFQAGKLLDTYHYHIPVYNTASYGLASVNMANYKTFIFYPLAETYTSEEQILPIRDERTIDDGGPGLQPTQNNKQFFESLPIDQQQEILGVSEILSSKILYFIDNVKTERMGDKEILKNYLIKTYFQDGDTKKDYHPDILNAIRAKILNPSLQEEGEDYGNNPYIIYNNKILYAQSQSGVDSEHYVKLLPRQETRSYLYMGKVYAQDINANENLQAKSLTFKEEDLEKFGKVYTDILTNKPIIQETYSDDNNETEKPSIYPDYLNKIGKEELENLQNLLKQATQLLHLYEQQYENYLSKYSEYSAIYEEYNTIFNQFQGTEEMRYYQNNNNMTIEDYRQKVREAWWAFLNILDYTYTKERERGLYA